MTHVEVAELTPQAVARRQAWGVLATVLWTVLVCVLMVAAQLVAAGVVSAIVLQEGAAERARIAELSSGRSTSVALVVSSLTVCLLTCGLVALRRGPPLRTYLALRPVPARTLAKGAALSLAITLLTDLWLLAWGRPLVHPSVRHQLASVGNLLPLLVFGVVVCAPLWEELLFRGFAYTGLVTRLAPWTSALLTSVAWTFLHAQYSWLEWIPLLVTGVALTELRRRTQSLYPALLCHGLVNAIAIAEAIWT